MTEHEQRRQDSAIARNHEWAPYWFANHIDGLSDDEYNLLVAAMMASGNKEVIEQAKSNWEFYMPPGAAN